MTAPEPDDWGENDWDEPDRRRRSPVMTIAAIVVLVALAATLLSVLLVVLG